jgi:glycosyltransferase involved in cell wall biosynthesis
MGSGHNAGAETTLHDILGIVKRAGHKATALASRPFKDGSGSYVLDGVMVQAFASKRDPELYFPNFDLILTQFECAQRAWYIGLKLGKPTVQLVHNNTEYSTNLALRYNDYLVYNSNHVRESIESKMSTVKPAVTLHPPVDPRRYEVDSSREYITLVNLSDGDEPFYNKGYDTFYQLAVAFPGEKFLGVKGAYGNQVVRDLPNVTIIEHTNNILDVYRKSKIILAPSEIESWGRVPIEAACSGIPSLTSTAPGLMEHAIGYRQIPFGKTVDWVLALEDLLENYRLASWEATINANKLYEMSQREIRDFIEFIEQIK